MSDAASTWRPYAAVANRVHARVEAKLDGDWLDAGFERLGDDELLDEAADAMFEMLRRELEPRSWGAA